MSDVLQVLSFAADVIAIVGIPFTAIRLLIAMLERRRLNQEVVVKIVNGQKEYPLRMRRKDVTRAEVLGRVGMVGGANRVTIGYFNTADFLENLKNVYEGGKSHSLLMIPVTDNEYGQFQFDHFEAKG